MKKPYHKLLKRNGGQAAVEFISVVVVIFFFLLFFMSLSFVMVISQYVDYATFMAARTFKTGLSTREVQERRAREVFEKYMEKVQGIARNYSISVVDAEPDRWQSAGMLSKFDINLFYLPPVFVTNSADRTPSNITLQSETHLGRDPAFQDCLDFFTNFSRRFSLGIEGTPFAEMMDDNGC